MKFRAILCLLLLGFITVDTAIAGSASATDQKTIAFVSVNVIPMDRERVIKDQTVIVRDGRIAELGDAAKVKVPAGAERIDGRGKYLLPGLIDMHAHLFSDYEFPEELAGDELMIMLANGVTTIRLMIGTPEHLILREKVKQGQMTGPAIYAASPQLAGRSYFTRSQSAHGRFKYGTKGGRDD